MFKPSIFNRNIIEKFQVNAPRYTSYPTADKFNTDFNKILYIETVRKRFANDSKLEPISLYIHIPFCNTLCLFCGCNKIITNDRSKIGKYLDYLEREIQLYFEIIQQKLNVVQLHFGGGSPSWMSIDELNRLMSILGKYFNLENAQEIAMEIDPRHTKNDFILALKQNGFNRISLGVQDLDVQVQKAVNRIQPLELTSDILNYARSIGFKSTNFDLIYGLPFQTVDGFSKTIDSIIELKPDRISLFNYAHIPSLFMPQTRISEADMPSASQKLDILQMSVNKLIEAKYVFIGMDHFAAFDDDLTKAYLNGTLQRNFQGYSTFADTNMLAFGLSSIGFINNSYYQNEKSLDAYYQSIENKEIPIVRGLKLDVDDLIRMRIIQNVMCQFRLDFKVIESSFDINFSEYFKDELIALEEIAKLGLINLYDSAFDVNDSGRFLIRNVAVIFDKYYRQVKDVTRYSKVI